MLDCCTKTGSSEEVDTNANWTDVEFESDGIGTSTQRGWS